MIILGVDPGTQNTGFGIIKFKDNLISYIHSGVIVLPKQNTIPQKLEIIYNELNKIIKRYKPDEFSLETAFYGKNVQSALKIGYARGVAMLASSLNGLNVGEYSPREVKKSVVGNGNASKEQVQFMIMKLLSLNEKKMKFDETDALAVACCHAFNIKNPVKRAGSWKKFVEENPDLVEN
ncbi:MAG: crossover junction endodeoxyribonuclease RuvC [Ignavibacteria bacterium]|nr:MAG: crossover junction endodeoxyribonuclease RuvC [Ignavibacteria bacterium]